MPVTPDKSLYIDHEESEMEDSLLERLALETFDMIAVGLPGNINDESFYRYFSKFGKLKLCEVRRFVVAGASLNWTSICRSAEEELAPGEIEGIWISAVCEIRGPARVHQG